MLFSFPFRGLLSLFHTAEARQMLDLAFFFFFSFASSCLAILDALIFEIRFSFVSFLVCLLIQR